MDKRTGEAHQESDGAIRKDQRLSSRNFPQVCDLLYATSQRTLQQKAGVDRVKSAGIVIEIDLRIAAQLTVKVRAERADFVSHPLSRGLRDVAFAFKAA
jgi:hypothetical protein